MEILAYLILGLLALFVVVVVIGKLKGAPLPKDMSDETIIGRLQSEGAWIKKYQALPYEHQQGAALKNQHDGKQRYIEELMLELKARHIEKP